MPSADHGFAVARIALGQYSRMPCRKVGLPQLVGEPRQHETCLARAGRVFDRDAEFGDGFGLAAGGDEHPRQQDAALGIRRHLGEFSAQRSFGIGGTAGLQQSPDVVRRRTHGGRLVENSLLAPPAPCIPIS